MMDFHNVVQSPDLWSGSAYDLKDLKEFFIDHMNLKFGCLYYTKIKKSSFRIS